MYAAIVFLPIIGFGHRRAVRPRDRRARQRAGHHRPAVRLRRSVGGRLQRCGAAGPQIHHPDPALDPFRRLRRRLDGPDRQHHRGDAGGGDGRLIARASLFHRLHARRPAPAALLLLSVAVHLRHADAGDGQQLPADVLRLGRRGPGVLSADRLLVPEAVGQCRGDEGLHRQPRRRFRLHPGCLRHLGGVRHASTSTRCSRPPRTWWASSSSSPATASIS